MASQVASNEATVPGTAGAGPLAAENKRPETGVRRLLELVGEHRGLLVAGGVLSVLSTVWRFAPFIAVYAIVAELLTNAATPASIDFDLVRRWGVYTLVFLAGSLVFHYFGSIVAHIAALRTVNDLRVRLTGHLARLPLGYFNRRSTGAIEKNLETSAEYIENLISHQIPDLAGAIILPLLMLGVMFWLDWRLALVSALPIIVAFGMQMRVLYRRETQQNLDAYLRRLERMNSEAVEYVRGMPAVKVFGLTVRNFLGLEDSIDAYRDLALDMTRDYRPVAVALNVLLPSILTFIVPIAILVLSGQPNNQALALTTMVFLVVAPGLSLPVLEIIYLAFNLQMVMEVTKSVDDILSQAPVPEPSVEQSPQGHDITFDDVSFSYADEDAETRIEALSGVSFTARAGQITALVGPSGSGKSTIANLIPRFWDVDDGAIRIGGVDVREMGTERLMDTVSFVFQDVHLFSDTLEENIRMGNGSASEQEVVAAARAASCHEFIARLPQGYQTRIGEGGTHLSGGEAQRVAIARAILKNAPILVLDEATAFADPENEIRIQQGLTSLIRDKTVVVIAHRLKTIKEADQIVVLQEGRVETQGSHDALLGEGGLYARMWQAHTDAGAWELVSAEPERGAAIR